MQQVLLREHNFLNTIVQNISILKLLRITQSANPSLVHKLVGREKQIVKQKSAYAYFSPMHVHKSAKQWCVGIVFGQARLHAQKKNKMEEE